MSLKDQLKTFVTQTFRGPWDERNGTTVPSDDSRLGLGNTATKIAGAVLYSDMADSTRLVDTNTPKFAAEIYKTFLFCAGKCIRAEGGEITAYDGDRIMAVFIGAEMCKRASRAAMKIRHAELHIIKPELKAAYSSSEYQPGHVTGIDASPLFVARTGVRGANDLVWVGKAANYAAKLSSINEQATFITDRVYDQLPSDAKVYDGKDMWTPRTWSWNQARIYSSTWNWPV